MSDGGMFLFVFGAIRAIPLSIKSFFNVFNFFKEEFIFSPQTFALFTNIF